MEVVKFEEFGLDEQKAKEITKDLPQIISERDILAEQYNEIIKMDIEEPATAKLASDLRKLIKKNRTSGIEAWHKANKEYFLRGGQFVDAIKKKEIAENIRMEDILEEIEKHQERKEQQRLQKLNEERVALVAPYLEDVAGLNLSFMEEDVFQAYLTAKKSAYEAKIAEQKRLEEERLESERLDRLEVDRKLSVGRYSRFSVEQFDFRNASESEFEEYVKKLKKAESEYEEEQVKIRLENERLKKEAEEKERIRLAEEAERKKKEEEEARQRAIEEAKKQAELDRIKAELEAETKRKAELEAREAARKKAEEEELLRIERERILAEEEAKKAPDKDKITRAINNLQLPVLDLEEMGDTYNAIVQKFDAFKSWAIKQLTNP